MPLAVAIPGREIDALALAPLIHPVPGLGAGDGAWARPFGLAHDVAVVQVPYLEKVWEAKVRQAEDEM